MIFSAIADTLEWIVHDLSFSGDPVRYGHRGDVSSTEEAGAVQNRAMGLAAQARMYEAGVIVPDWEVGPCL